MCFHATRWTRSAFCVFGWLFLFLYNVQCVSVHLLWVSSIDFFPLSVFDEEFLLMFEPNCWDLLAKQNIRCVTEKSAGLLKPFWMQCFTDGEIQESQMPPNVGLKCCTIFVAALVFHWSFSGLIVSIGLSRDHDYDYKYNYRRLGCEYN